MTKQVPSLSTGKFHLYDLLHQIGAPVMEAGRQGRLRDTMPVKGAASDRASFSPLEAVARLLCGAAPALELNNRQPEDPRFSPSGWIQDARDTLDAISRPASRLNFSDGQQPLVDAAFLATAFLRAPEALWLGLPSDTQAHLMDALRSTRKLLPFANNWILFPAVIEAFFCYIGEPYDQIRIEYALSQMDQWYLGDGYYGDGPEFQLSYYNSIVIHPLLLEICRAIRGRHIHIHWEKLSENFLQRAQIHAVHLERIIGPDGSFPLIGRSLTYRCGIFHLLSQLLWLDLLSKDIPRTQVHSALGATIQATLKDKDTCFDANGWLNIGITGKQLDAAENYITTGSLYMACTAFLHLGCPLNNDIWQAPPRPWTQLKYFRKINTQPQHLAPSNHGKDLANAS